MSSSSHAGERDRSLGRALLWLFAVLAVASAVCGLRLEDDSYQHFARSYRQVASRDVEAWLLDVWNKPLIGLIYGVPGLLGVTAARLVSVGFALATAWLTAKVAEHCLDAVPRPPAWLLVLLFASELALLKDAFVTMSELPAAFFVALTLWLALSRERTFGAALSAGLIPLCRVELLPVSAFIGAWLGLRELGRGRAQLPSRMRSALAAALALVPFSVWVVAGALISHDLSWFRRSSYAYLRSWDLAGLVRYNALGGLASVLCAPELLFLFWGFFAARTQLKRRRELLLLFGVIGLHYFILNALVVFPRGFYGLSDGHGIAALNARNYTPSAAVATLFMACGVSAWQRALCTEFWWASALACSAIVLGHARSGPTLALDLTLLAASMGVVGFSLHSGERRGRGVVWKPAALLSVLAALSIRPFFWYPTRWNDQRAASADALVELVRRERPQRVIQDLASSLELYGGLSGIDASWTYPHDFPARAATSAPLTLLVLETDARGAPLPRYPRGLTAGLEPSAQRSEDAPGLRAPSLEEVGRYTARPQRGWLAFVDRIAARNEPVSWRAFRVRAPHVAR